MLDKFRFIFASVRISKRREIIFGPRCVMYERGRERSSLSLSISQITVAGRCSVFGGGAFSHRCSRRHRSPAGVAVRYRSRAAVVVGSARASGGACRPDGTLFFRGCTTARRRRRFRPDRNAGHVTPTHTTLVKIVRTFSLPRPSTTDNRDRNIFVGIIYCVLYRTKNIPVCRVRFSLSYTPIIYYLFSFLAI